MQGALNLEYVRADEVAEYLKKHDGHVLGLVAFGAGADSQSQVLQPPPLRVPIPVVGEKGASYEVWTSGNPVVTCGQGNISAAADGSVLFGGLRMEQAEGVTLEALTRQAYTEIFGFIERQGYRNPLRIWNYFPHITEYEHGLERYRCFNVGRHEAFVLSGRDIGEESVPAASVLGCDPGPLVIYFLAGKQPGLAIDNPRQMNAYRYPERYGPRSPIFVRAMLVTLGRQQLFVISGTASIVGYETLHHGDVEKQTQETLLNIRTLLQQVPGADADGGRMLLKVYLRNQADLERVKALLAREFGVGHQAVYLQSNICRPDLLIEIEGVCFNQIAS
jgi:chorismate lyase / 3-hydroxybenzoate synthase